MSTQGIDPGRRSADRFDPHAFEIAIGLLLFAATGLDLSGLMPLKGLLPWLFVAYGIMVLILEILFTKPSEQIDPIVWACVTGYLAAASIICTRLVQGFPPSALIWAASLALFAALSAVLAITMDGRTISARTASVSIVIVVATFVAATIVMPTLFAHLDRLIYAIAAFVATSITLLLLFLNERIFDKRSSILQRLLDDLAAHKPAVRQDTLSLLTMAAHKYGATPRNNPPPSPGSGSPPPNIASPAGSRWPLVLSASAYLAFCIMGYVVLLAPIAKVFAGWITNALFWSASASPDQGVLINTVAVAGAAFLGAHIFTLRYLFKAALNSELNQFKWIRGALHLLTGVVVALILYRALNGTGWLKEVIDGKSSVWLGIAFASGWIPDFALTNLFRYIKVNNLKGVDEDIMKLVSVIPIEVIDGIDYDTRYRLEENNIVDVQSLATYNPILLYVETPFGLAQIYDWILQAQLCLAVGPRPYIEFKKIAIRTIFQLQDETQNASDGYTRMIGGAMYSSASADRLKAIMAAGAGTPPPPAEIDPKVIKYAVDTIGKDPYLVALRSLWQYIYA